MLLYGAFDIIVIISLMLINLILWKIRINQNIGCLISGVLFGLILPIISMGFEIDKVTARGEIIDNFEVLYTYFRFPVYWLIGIIQLVILSVKQKRME